MPYYYLFSHFRSIYPEVGIMTNTIRLSHRELNDSATTIAIACRFTRSDLSDHISQYITHQSVV